MIRRRWQKVALSLGLLASVGVALSSAPAARAFSFGVFAPGDTIASVVLSPTGSTPLVTYTAAGTTLVFDAHVTTINMTSGAIFNIAPGDVVFDSTLMLVGGSAEFLPSVLPSFVAGNFTNGVTADLSITDLAGSTVLLEADYDSALRWEAQDLAPTVVNSTLTGSFTNTGGNGGFLAAFGPTGDLDAFFTAFLSNGLPVSSVCDLVTPNCISPTAFDNWTANPNVTITTTGIPEPGTLGLLFLAGGAMELWRRRGVEVRP